MAKDNQEENNTKNNDGGLPQSFGLINQSITTEMKNSYLDYAMSVITTRALPDVRDGLKPVHRRILYSMHENGLGASAKTRKSATVVGGVLGNYHPHGDTSVYDAMVKMAQVFSFRYPLVIGQGNFGSIDGDPPAAYRYTEAKMSKIAELLLKDIEKNTVDFRPNYDGTRSEPSVLPAALPSLLLNGTLGIAVGMATNIPPHNLRETIDATLHLLDNREATTEDLLQFVKGPDFPTGAIIFNQKDIHHAYATGRGGIVTRGEAEIIETKSGMYQIIITSIPFRVNKSDLIMKIADLVRDKKIDGIKGLRDESTKDIRIVIDLKSSGNSQKILNYLYKHTQLEDTFYMNLVALVAGVPQTLSLRAVLVEFINHRVIVIRRRTEFELMKAEDREHILIGLKKALDYIDQIIKLIKGSKDAPEAHQNLMKEYKFSDRQAAAILDLKLQRLAGLERKKIDEELKAMQDLIIFLKDILAHPKKIDAIINNELKEYREKFGDDRRTKVMKSGAKVLNAEDLIEDTENTLVLSAGGYIKRTNPDEYKRQKRGGVGVIDLSTKEEDFVTTFLNANTHSDILFFSDKGKVYQLKMYDLPEGKKATKGKSVMNYLSLDQTEKISAVLSMPKTTKESALSIIMVTRDGVAKKVSATSFHDVRRSGIMAIKIGEGDELVASLFVDKGESVIVASSKGQSIRFKESDIREMGRGAAGVRAIKLGKGDGVIASQVVKKGAKDVFLVVSENGFGKKTDIGEYKIQNRGGSGIKTAKITAKTGNLIAGKILGEEESELVAISKKGQVIRLGVDEIPNLGRQTQGVRIMKVRAGDGLASVVCL